MKALVALLWFFTDQLSLATQSLRLCTTPWMPDLGKDIATVIPFALNFETQKNKVL